MMVAVHSLPLGSVFDVRVWKGIAMTNRLISTLAALLVLTTLSTQAARADKDLLEETVGFMSQIIYLQAGTPAFIIGVVKDGETFVAGHGEYADGADAAPDGNTPMRIGSITKAFTGQVLAAMVADGTVSFSDPVSSHLDWDITWPRIDGRELRLIDLVTHSGGLPREIDHPQGPPEDPFLYKTLEAYKENLEAGPLVFKPGAGISYSNFGFDLLAHALSGAAGMPYEDLLKHYVLDPAGMTGTVFELTPEQETIAMQGHAPNGAPMPHVPTGTVVVGSSGLYTTTNDMLKWFAWHMDRNDPAGDEVRLLDHATYLTRDGMDVVFGMDESGFMDGMALGWVVMNADQEHPLILQKAGGRQGMLVYGAFSPTRNIGIFAAINAFDFNATVGVNAAVNALIGELSE
jgi:serine-type D-Ala-D-Ala carboxypeptidase/endopeptidase